MCGIIGVLGMTDVLDWNEDGLSWRTVDRIGCKLIELPSAPNILELFFNRLRCRCFNILRQWQKEQAWINQRNWKNP